MSSPASSADLASYFASKLVGQPNAAERIIPFIQTFRAGLNHANRPVGVFLLLGPTGTGKTRTVEVLADALHGDPQHYLRVDCGEFQLDHEVAKLIGAPPGYIGHRESVPVLSNQKMLGAVTPACNIALVLFDEIEKAAPSLTQLLLGVLDKGRLTLGDGTVVSFENALVFLTSNLGAREMMQEMTPTFGFEASTRPEGKWPDLAGKLESIALGAVRKRFSPEFINRIDAVITYQPLSADAIGLILDHQIEELQEHVNSRLGSRGFSIELNPSARDFLLSRGVSVEYGARELKRVVYRHLTQPLATLVAENRVPAGTAISVYAMDGADSLGFATRDTAAPVREAPKPSVLIVDDNDSLLKFLKRALGEEGWRITVASSAQSAIKLAENNRFDVGLIDYMLPDTDGAALLVKLKALLPRMELIMMTGGGEMSFSKQSELAEVPVVQKPFIVEDLVALVSSRLPKQKDSAAATSS